VAGNRAEWHADLGQAATTDPERRLLAFLLEGSFRLPNAVSELVPNALARPDFVYHLTGGSVAVFVDGPPDGAAPVAQRDEQAEDRLLDLGWLVVRFRHNDDWSQTVAKYPSVFGVGRSL
jgi:hypothetical protein